MDLFFGLMLSTVSAVSIWRRLRYRYWIYRCESMSRQMRKNHKKIQDSSEKVKSQLRELRKRNSGWGTWEMKKPIIIIPLFISLALLIWVYHLATTIAVPRTTIACSMVPNSSKTAIHGSATSKWRMVSGISFGKTRVNEKANWLDWNWEWGSDKDSYRFLILVHARIWIYVHKGHLWTYPLQCFTWKCICWKMFSHDISFRVFPRWKSIIASFRLWKFISYMGVFLNFLSLPTSVLWSVFH